MSYAVRNDKKGFRAVNGPDDVGLDEYYSDVPVDISPASEVPDSVTMRQARLALNSAGLLTQVEAAINALPEPSRTEARIEWDFSSEVFRDRDFVKMLGTSLGLTSIQMDELFITAATL